MPAILVTGGAGYIGAHTVRALLAAGHCVFLLDDLSAGHRSTVPDGVPLHVAGIQDVARVLAADPPDAVVHFAGATEAGLSMTDPRRFYRVNVTGSLALFDALVDLAALQRRPPPPVVFSSSAAVYGTPGGTPIPENAPTRPDSVYGRTKLDVEQALAAYGRAYQLRSISLRYFNAAGAARAGGLGEDHPTETHLIPLAITAALGSRDALTVFGTDYPTPDGTCVRDYVHVDDLARAHLLAVDALLAGSPSATYNVGVGTGFSVRQVLAAVGSVAGRPVPALDAGRRPGDPPELVADPARIAAELGWRPEVTSLEAIVRTAWAWHSSQGPSVSAAASKKP